MHAQLNREEVLAGCQAVARCTTARLMRDLGLRGISRAKGPRTTVPGTGPDTRKDLVKRVFTADRPDRLWVADITYSAQRRVMCSPALGMGEMAFAGGA